MYKSFQELHKTITKKKAELLAEKSALIEKETTLNAEYSHMLANEAIGIDGVTASQLAAKKKELDKVKSEITAVKDRLSAIESAEKARLREQLPTAKKERDEAVIQKIAECEDKIKEIKKYQAGYVIKLAELHSLNMELRNIQEEFKALARQAGANEYERMINTSINSLLSHTNPIAGGISGEVAYQAFIRGLVPSWIRKQFKEEE